MSNTIAYPFDANFLLRKKKSIKKSLLDQENLIEKRITILGGSTTAEMKDMLELFLLNEGIKPVFYESEYNRYFEDLMFSNATLKDFSPDLIYIHTSNKNITRYPSVGESEDQVEKLFAEELAKFVGLWDRIASEYSCAIIQNNFELPYYRLSGNFDNYNIHGRTNFISRLNGAFGDEARKRESLYLNDINYLSAWFGLERWYNKLHWYSFKYAMNIEAIPHLAHSVSSIVKTIYGFSKKCLVLDLDNTLWGGVIGDDGVNQIRIGKETAEAEAYTEFQEYVKMLKERGVILAICSKNDELVAVEGFSHPDSVLKLEDFSNFKANWNPKHENIRAIASQLNIGIDSLVFLDDNPVERDIVARQLPQVSVVELGSDVTQYISIVDRAGLFETVSMTADDLNRNTYYSANAVRTEVESKYQSYEEFLLSLNMVAEIMSFKQIYLDRITQLINKTNQFNLTTKRYTQSEIETIFNDQNYIKLYGRLEDKFGDNGLISIIIGIAKGEELHIELWLMSCRVLKRGMEVAMFDQLVADVKGLGIKTIIGYYYKSLKNSMVSELFRDMGFRKVSGNSDSIWSLDITQYQYQNKLITIRNDN
jgi:FkbH-like protein